jgi:hypothetical protein
VTNPQPLEPTDPTAPALAAAMATPELVALPVITARVLRRLTQLWVQLFGSIRVLPSAVVAGRVRNPGEPVRLRLPQERGPATPIDFPQVWTDAVDDGLAEVITAMERAAESTRRHVETAPVQRPLTYRRERVRRAVALTEQQKRGFAAVQDALAQPVRLVEDVRTVVSGDLVQQHTEEQHAEARRRGGDWVLIWVAERDACVRCLAYAGEHVIPGAKFEGGQTFGPRWPSVIGRPPLLGPGWFEGEGSHPNCRCELKLIRRRDVEPAADALRREARRSVAKGWARPTEGQNVRVVAAQRLLAGAADLPRSVIDETRRRLKRPGEFRRAVPSP